MPKQEPLVGFGEAVEPIKVVEIGCGVTSDGTPHDQHTGRMYDLPYEYAGIEREEKFAISTSSLDEDEKKAAREKAVESGIIFGNAADLPFEDESIDVITMRSVFGQFTDSDSRELYNVIRCGLMEAFRVLRPEGIVAISEESTPWDEKKVFHYLNAFGFTVIDYVAMQRDWSVPERRDFQGFAMGDYRNVYAPENEEWLKKLGQFYRDEHGLGILSTRGQYVMVGKKQQPATVELTAEWQEWSVAEDRLHYRDSEPVVKQKTYKCGQRVIQEYLPGMHSSNRHNAHVYNPQQKSLFLMPSRSLFY